MPRYAQNKMPAEVKRRYFELIRTGLSGSAAAQEVGVSLSCGSLWFIDAGRVSFIETPISPRYLSQDDRIEIADGLADGEPVKLIAARIGKTFQTVYREIARNRKPDGRYQPWYRAQPGPPAAPTTQAAPLQRRCRAALRPWPASSQSTGHRPRSAGGCGAVTDGAVRLARVYRDHLRGGLPRPDRPGRQAEPAHRAHVPAPPRPRPNPRRCAQAIHRHEVDPRAAIARSLSRRQAGHWEGDLLVGAGQRSAIATLVERKARLTILVPVPRNHSAQSVGDALIGAFTKLPARLRRTLTWDQGNEMFHHERIEASTPV